MTIDLNRITLTVGSHIARDDGVCMMEAVAWWAGEEHSDAPRCVSPVLAIYGAALNDLLPDASRQALIPLIPLLAGTAEDGRDEARGHLALDWIVRTYTPPWLELAGLEELARRLRALEPITDLRSARAAEPAVLAARKAARVAAGDAAWDAAWAEAGDATWDAAWAAARVAGASTGASAWDAAWNAKVAARIARVAARTALAPTVAEIQASALDLLQRMIRPDQP